MTEWLLPPKKDHPGFAIGDRVENGSGNVGTVVVPTEATTSPEWIGSDYNRKWVQFRLDEPNYSGRRYYQDPPKSLKNLSRRPQRARIEGNELILEDV